MSYYPKELQDITKLLASINKIIEDYKQDISTFNRIKRNLENEYDELLAGYVITPKHSFQ